MMSPYNIKSWDNEVITVLNNALFKFVSSELKKGAKKQNGGRIVMPLEYFGVDSKNFVATSNGASVQATADYIRPPMEMNILGAAQQGGAKKTVNVPLNVIQTTIEEVSAKVNKQVENKGKVAKQLKARFESTISGVLERASKKAEKNHLSSESLKEVLAMKKYSKLA